MNNNEININWYPGHMAKTKRLIKEKYDLIDIVYEVIDARMPKSSKIKDIDGYLGTADTLVSYDDKYKDIVLNQLGNVIVVDNIDTLNKVGKLIQYKYKIVSLDGEISYSGGAITGGTTKNSGSVINQKYELEDLKKNVKTDKITEKTKENVL